LARVNSKSFFAYLLLILFSISINSQLVEEIFDFSFGGIYEQLVDDFEKEKENNGKEEKEKMEFISQKLKQIHNESPPNDYSSHISTNWDHDLTPPNLPPPKASLYL